MSFYIYIFFSFFFFTISFLFLCIMYTSLPIHTVFSFLNRFVCLARFFSDFFRFFASYIFFLFCSVKEGFTIHCVQINILMYLDGNRRKESSIFWEKIKLRVFCMNASFSIKVLAYLNWKWYLRIERQENVLYFFYQNKRYAVFISTQKYGTKENTSILLWLVVVLCQRIFKLFSKCVLCQ